MERVLNYVVDNIISDSAILLGLVAALGLILLKKKWDEVLKGAFLAAIGMTIIQQAIEILKVAIIPEDALLGDLASSGGATILSDTSFLAEYGSQVGLAMLLGMVLHVLIARFTRIKTIFLTGHMLFWIPFVFVAAAVEAGLGGVWSWITAGIFSALYWSIMPWVVRKFVFKVIGDESFTLGHPSSVLALIAGGVAKLTGNPSKSTEDLKISKRLSFLREIPITGGTVITLLYIVIGIVMKDGLVAMGRSSVFFFALEHGFMFGCGLAVLLMGVRMLIGQIVPAFEGISTKLVKNALPAYDCPMLFNYRPNAVIIGFLIALVTSSVFIVICDVFNVFGVFLIPLVVTSFFECGAAAVVADGQGGLRGTIIGTLVVSVIMVGLVGISAVVFGSTIQNWILVSGGNDFSLFGPIAVYIDKLIALIFS